MKLRLSILMILVFAILSSCSGGGVNPVTTSSTGPNESVSVVDEKTEPVVASDVLYDRSSDGTIAYKAFGAFEVKLDPKTMNVELIPTRKAKAIGTTFDSDLTQFLTVSPCTDCLKIDGIRYAGDNQFEIGFAIKHPFADITKRPDLHVFDVRGIVIANGNYNFPLTKVMADATTELFARANVSLIANADGWTHHFVELIYDSNYFDPPKTWDVNINPYKRYFVDGTTPIFDPHNPTGFNVMKVGAGWQTQKYMFNLPSSSEPLDFVFVLDCSYGQSATFQNRQTPYYFLPEFNRKEAWKVDVIPMSGDFQSHNTGSSVNYQVSVCDWQNILFADPEYPDTTNLGGIKAESDVKSVSIEIPAVSELVETTTLVSGDGYEGVPYIFNLTVSNSKGAGAGWYWGIAAVRDDLQGQQGPIAIPETPAGFPFPGPEIYDYSTYNIFPVRVKGSAPEITGFNYISNLKEGETTDISADVVEPDGDVLTYHWEQVSPASPVGIFADQDALSTVWQAPPVFDILVSGVPFILSFTVSDIDSDDTDYAYIIVTENNSSPICTGITTNPYWGIIDTWQSIGMYADGYDLDGDTLKYEWDYDWDGNGLNFDVDATGQYPTPHAYGVAGFYLVGCRVSEDNRANYLSSSCSKQIIVQGIRDPEFKVDDSDASDPQYCDHDIAVINYPMNNPVYHATYCVLGGSPVMYCNTARDPHMFANHQVISRGPSSGSCEFPKVAGYDKLTHVIWIENDTSTVPTTYRIKINSSDDGGMSFGAMGGERIVTGVQNPDVMGEADICAGNVIGLFYLAYSVQQSGNYLLWLWVSDDGGETWHQPVGGSGAFRDVINTDYAGRPELEFSPDGVIHVLWQDLRTGSSQYFYDWSSDGGVTWHSDVQVTDATLTFDCNMAVDNVNNAYFVWNDSDKKTYFRKTQFGNPPTFSPHEVILDFSAASFRGVDIMVTPLADIIVVPVMYLYSGNYQATYFYSRDYGESFDSFFISSYGTNQTDNISCDGYFQYEPGRLELCSIWVDERTSLAPFNDHIWGEFTYFADRP